MPVETSCKECRLTIIDGECGCHRCTAGCDDHKGRPHIQGMSDRHLLEDIAENQRKMVDMVESFVTSMANNPMLGMMSKMLGGKRN